MKQLMILLYTLGGLLLSSHLKAQVVLEALEGEPSIENNPNATISFNNGVKYFISIYDNNYLPYTQPTQPATWDRPVNAGVGNNPLIDFQGTITTEGIKVDIPISSASSGSSYNYITLPAYSQQISVPAEYTEDGISRMVELSWERKGDWYIYSRSIEGTIKAIGGTLNIKKLDLNAGLGKDNKGLLLARFPLPKIGSTTSDAYFDLRVMSGIPDKKFGVETNYKYEHQFIYLPITDRYGNWWLNNNLGADYSNINSKWFNPTYQAGAYDANTEALTSNPNQADIRLDYRAYGSLFEQGRKADGHELMDWWPHSSGKARYPLQRTPSIDQSDVPFYQTEDPCPPGWEVPDLSGWGRLLGYTFGMKDVTEGGASYSVGVFDHRLKLPLTPYVDSVHPFTRNVILKHDTDTRIIDGVTYNSPKYGYYTVRTTSTRWLVGAVVADPVKFELGSGFDRWFYPVVDHHKGGGSARPIRCHRNVWP